MNIRSGSTPTTRTGTAAPAANGTSRHWDPAFATRSPMFAPYAAFAEGWAALPQFPSIAQCQALLDGLVPPLCSATGARLVVEPAQPATALEYEQRIHRAGRLGLRTGNWHDLMNLLVWCRFPQAKAALNAAHGDAGGAAPTVPGRGHGRGRRRDALTLFDESGVILFCADPELAQLLRSMCWQPLFVERRARVLESARFVVFGHGLLDRAQQPFPGLTGHTLVIEVAAAELAAVTADVVQRGQAASWLDQRVAAAIDTLAEPSVLAPLPLLGVPGWCAANEEPAYYADTRWFRPSRGARLRTDV
jgi:hypothetical protein